MRRMIGVSIGARDTTEAHTALREVAQSAAIGELRLDLMNEYDLSALLDERPCPVVVTNRAEREGGKAVGDDAYRVQPLLQAIDMRAEYVDIEHDAVHLIHDTKDTKLIASSHDFQRMPHDLPGLHNKLVETGADVVKLVGAARRLSDNVDVLELLSGTDVQTIAIAMGEAGLVSRVLALRYDSCLLTYSTLDKGETVAPGQLTISSMRNTYRANHIGAESAVFGVLSDEFIDDPMVTALNAATRHHRVDGVWVPLIARYVDEKPSDVIDAFRRISVAGYAVLGNAQTGVAQSLDLVKSSSPSGRIDTVRLEEGILVGSWSGDLRQTFETIIGQEAPASLS